MEVTTEYLPIFIHVVKALNSLDTKELIINGYYVFPDMPEGLEDGLIEFLNDGDVSSIYNKLDSMRRENSRRVGFWTVWEVEHVCTFASWLGEEEYDYSVRLLGIADETKWTPQSLGLIEA